MKKGLATKLFPQLLHPASVPEGTPPDRNELADLWALAQQHNLTMLLYSQLGKHFAENDRNVAGFLEEKRNFFLGNVVRSMSQESEEKKLLALLQEHGADACIIKGNELARQIYRNPNSRASCDIDMLVRARDVPEVDRLLDGAGYKRNDSAPLKFWMERLHHASYFNETNGHTVEVHWNFGIPAFFNLTSDEIWSEVGLTEQGRVILSPELHLIQTLIHHHMHAFRELKVLVDLLWIFHAYEEAIDWMSFASRLKGIGLIKTLQISIDQLRALWGESCEAMKSLESLEEAYNAMGYDKPAVLCSYFSLEPGENKQHSPGLDKLMTRFTLDRSSTIIFSFLKTFIPPPAALKALFADQRNSPLPVLYLRFLKWRIRLRQ
jgi:hypothetical protein